MSTYKGKHIVKILTKKSKYYPEKLKEIKDAPEILFVIGDEKILNDTAIAIIGSRKASEYGKNAAEYFAKALSTKNIRIISGLAEGIDTYAHRGSLKNKTIAVLGNGLNITFPASNKKLIDEIIKNGGAIITEYFFNEHGNKYTFPKRNRIIAGLSDGIIVVEARQKSGALITVEYGQKYKKKIFAIPSNIDNEKAKGSNRLINLGIAKCTITPNDILKELKLENNDDKKQKEKTVPEEYKKIYELLKVKSMNKDEIAKKTKCDIKEINTKITLMEMQGLIKMSAGNIFNIC